MPRITSVWAIEEGSYSDYHIAGVFSSRKNAEAMAAFMSDANIVEWQIDPFIDKLNKGLVIYEIEMRYNGNVEELQRMERGSSYELDSLELGNRLHVFDNIIKGAVWARDEKHAVKIANEFRTRAIAEGKMYTGL
jgi:hypothetical protein